MLISIQTLYPTLTYFQFPQKNLSTFYVSNSSIYSHKMKNGLIQTNYNVKYFNQVFLIEQKVIYFERITICYKIQTLGSTTFK